MIQPQVNDFGPRILVLAATDNPGSAESVLAGAVARELAVNGADVTRISLYDYPLPLIGTEPDALQVPRGAFHIASQIVGHERLLLISRDQNASLPALVKNMIDWVAAIRQPDHAGQSAFATPLIVLATLTGDKSDQSAIGEHLRTVLEAAGASQVARPFVFRTSEIVTDRLGHLEDRTVSIRIKTLSDTLLRVRQTGLPG